MMDEIQFIQIRLQDGSLLVFTKEEVERARKRGNSIIHNRKVKGRDLGPAVIRGEKVENA